MNSLEISILIVFGLFIFGLMMYIPTMLLADLKERDKRKHIIETDKDIFDWYEEKEKLTSKKKGRFHRSLIMGMYNHREK